MALPEQGQADRRGHRSHLGRKANRFRSRRGRVPELSDGSLSSSEVLQRLLGTTHAVKVFNNITFRSSADEGRGAAQHRPVQQPIESCLGDRSQVLALTAWKIQVEPGQRVRRGERVVLAVAGDQLTAQPGGLHDAQPLRQHRPRRGLVGGMETARPQPGQPRLRVGNHRVTAAHLRPATPVDVQRQEPARLRRGCIKITIAGQHHVRGIPGLGHLCFGAAPVTFGTEHRAQPRPGRLACQRRGGEALPEPRYCRDGWRLDAQSG